MSDLNPPSPPDAPAHDATWWTPAGDPPPVATPGEPAPAPPRRRRWPTVLLAIVVLLAVLVTIASRINLHYYAIQPGVAQPVGPLITVPPSKAHPIKGRILLTDVELGQVTLLNVIPYWLSSNTQIVSSDEVLSPGVSPGELDAQGFLEMGQSIDAAKTAALTRLGYTVTQRPGGVQVGATVSGLPAASALAVGDVITSVNGTATPDVCSFVSALHPLQPGDVAHLMVQPATVTSQGTLAYGRSAPQDVRMAPAPKGEQSSGCPGVSGPAKAVLGIDVVQKIDYDYPFAVSINTAGIGGPSAGLAMTLGIMDTLSGGHLSHGVVAATGTMNSAEQVGAVGGVPQKTIAVERGGATVFMVPPGPAGYGDAVSKATPSLHVCQVSTLGQALGVLQHYGGDVPASMHPIPVGPHTCT
jgi:Lon-like protease